jgi:hypothetical protein
VPYSGATGPVNISPYNLTLNTLYIQGGLNYNVVINPNTSSALTFPFAQYYLINSSSISSITLPLIISSYNGALLRIRNNTSGPLLVSSPSEIYITGGVSPLTSFIIGIADSIQLICIYNTSGSSGWYD